MASISSIPNPYRSCFCSSVELDRKVKLCGWVARKRDHGGLVFIDVRDTKGVIQLVFDSNTNDFSTAGSVPLESFIIAFGLVRRRQDENVNKSIMNGEIEVAVELWTLESKSDVLPFAIHDDKVSDELRLKYRFLDLRRSRMRKNVLLRSEITHYLRCKMYDMGFREFNTPVLTSSSPEGARDYLVPSRNFPGKFYALPQAPQQFKQLLMASGFDRYFQIAPCFRDEDSRANRAPGDFYQLDMEMSCVTQEEIFAVVEEIMEGVFSKFASCSLKGFPRLTYKDSMIRYGTDKPDLRNPLVIVDVTSAAGKGDFRVFNQGISQGKIVRSIAVGCHQSLSRSFFDKAIEHAKVLGADGLAYLQFDDSGAAKGPVAKFFSPTVLDELRDCNAPAGQKIGAIFFVCDLVEKANSIAGQLREYLASELGLLEEGFRFCWVVDFPYFKSSDNATGVDFFHNPFSMPKASLENLSNSSLADLLSIDAYQYDLVCNGVELASGAIRNHKIDLLKSALSLVGYTEEDMLRNFGGLLRAFQYGLPPHGGIAPGLERMIMLIVGEENIREVTCFPLSQRGEDLLMGSPSNVNEAHLKELGISVRKRERARDC